MRADEVDETMLDRAMDAYWDGDGGTREGLRAALAAVIPLVQQAEREACARDVELANPWRLSSKGEPYIRMAARIRARNTP